MTGMCAMSLFLTQALKDAGCDEVVLAINYQPKVSKCIFFNIHSAGT
jgi:hypothetical protein